MKSIEQAKKLLVQKFDTKHVSSALKHFLAAGEKYATGDWGGVEMMAGKFVEAVTKALMVFGGLAITNPRRFSAGAELRKFESAFAATTPDAIRIVIPKACLFAYEIASNRGGRHDAHEIDANEMDARSVLPTIAWVLAEMVRFCASASDTAAASAMVEELTAKTYPYLEDIDGRKYINIAGLKPGQIGLLLLYAAYPGRIVRQELVDQVVRHGVTKGAATTAVHRLKSLVDEDSGGWKLRGLGRQEAEALRRDLAQHARRSE